MRLILHDEDGICRDIVNQNDFGLFRVYRTEGPLTIERAKSHARVRRLIGNLPGSLVRTVINNAQCEGSRIYR